MTTYKILRFYANSSVDREVVETGQTLAEAKEHCKDPEASSRTCTSEDGQGRTAEFGNWFDGYEEE